MENHARLIGQKARRAWGQQVVAENRPGAGGALRANSGEIRRPMDIQLLTASIAYA